MALLPAKDIEGLYHTGMSNDYYKHSDRYEILKGKESDISQDGDGYMMLYSTKLEALISYNHFELKYKTVLLSDTTNFLGPNTFCIIVDAKDIDGNDWMDR